jgi:hypothetical protein
VSPHRDAPYRIALPLASRNAGPIVDNRCAPVRQKYRKRFSAAAARAWLPRAPLRKVSETPNASRVATLAKVRMDGPACGRTADAAGLGGDRPQPSGPHQRLRDARGLGRE